MKNRVSQYYRDEHDMKVALETSACAAWSAHVNRSGRERDFASLEATMVDVEIRWAAIDAAKKLDNLGK